ncbi:hypothetical protein IWC96_14370 [Brevundimonas sp. BAL450]|uniref:hypothetical protein n=1 Tax=Brevundimonas sp. BAL450 TaxID=1708162 RepID=UPI0018CBADD2|nr:hypothetical protein [Brevundimonas sp. BAL450]MBG7616459.1 hypothetical protein [Brevundimonas sp. BAL450]
MTLFRTFTRAGWIITAIGLIALLTLGYCAVTKPARDATKRAEANSTIADGRTGAAQDASVVRDGNDDARDATRTEVEDAQDEVRNQTDPAARDAVARRRLCRLNPGACPD